MQLWVESIICQGSQWALDGRSTTQARLPETERGWRKAGLLAEGLLLLLVAGRTNEVWSLTMSDHSGLR